MSTSRTEQKIEFSAQGYSVCEDLDRFEELIRGAWAALGKSAGDGTDLDMNTDENAVTAAWYMLSTAVAALGEMQKRAEAAYEQDAFCTKSKLVAVLDGRMVAVRQ